jgi:hypothetical protein
MDKKKTVNKGLLLKALAKVRQTKEKATVNGTITAEGRLEILAAEAEVRRILDPSVPVEAKPKQTRKPPAKKKAAPKKAAAKKEE